MAVNFTLHPNILEVLPLATLSKVEVSKHGVSHFGTTLKLMVHITNKKIVEYFLKILPDEIGISTCRGEFEALSAIYSTCKHVPKPLRWGSYKVGDSEKGFLLTEFMHIAHQPADPASLATILADLHLSSRSPTGRFGFHVSTVHTKNTQAIDFWTDSWCELFSSHFRQILSLAQTGLAWPAFDRLGQLVLREVIPRLLLPLQSDGRSIKPSLVHGDCWDGNTAITVEGRAVFFDVASFYGHNEYDLGDWRAPRHALSDPVYVLEYDKIVPRSAPVEDWDDRNRLYSLTWNICNALFVPGSIQRPQIYEDVRYLCEKFCSVEMNLSSESMKELVSQT